MVAQAAVDVCTPKLKGDAWLNNVVLVVNVDVVIGLMRDTQMFKFGWVGWTLFVGLNN